MGNSNKSKAVDHDDEKKDAEPVPVPEPEPEPMVYTGPIAIRLRPNGISLESTVLNGIQGSDTIQSVRAKIYAMGGIEELSPDELAA